jgi:hypothetical protein
LFLLLGFFLLIVIECFFGPDGVFVDAAFNSAGPDSLEDGFGAARARLIAGDQP